MIGRQRDDLTALVEMKGPRTHYECICPPLQKAGEGRMDIAWSAVTQDDELKPQRARSSLDQRNLPHGVFKILVNELSDDGRFRNDLM